MKRPLEQSSFEVEEGMWAPAEEVIKAFLDYLVDPLLPLKMPCVTPPESNQEKVAKQMHAVVLLYNYYQRKRHAQAEYLDFMSFCKLVVTLKPVLATYMPSMHRSEPTVSENLESDFSVTEKAIEEACTISKSLDVSKDIPDINECVVSKVAVFLVDSSKENCALSFGSHTDGVWSIFEKSIDNCVDNQENQAKNRNLNKKKRKRRQPTGEPDLQQLAFSALKEARGIERSHLTILEKHITYSFDKERTSACCFIVECRSTNQEFEFSVRDTIESMQGPLVKKISDDWTLTQLIEYYNVLPYAGIISRWFSRQFPLSSELLNASNSENYCGNDVPEYKKLDSKSMDVKGQNAENLEYRDNNISYGFTNANDQEDACERSYMSTQSKGDSTDVESDKTNTYDNLAKSISTESRGDYDYGQESENVKGINVNLSFKPFVSENLPRSKSNECKSDYHNESTRENVKGLDVNLSGTLSGAQTVPQKSKQETMNINGIESKKSERHFEKEANVQSSSENPNDNVKCAQKRSKWRTPVDKCARLHSGNNNKPGPVSIISANDGGLKEIEQPSVKEIQPSIKEVDGEENTSTNSVREDVGTFNSFARPEKEVKDLLKSDDAAESSLSCKHETNPLVLYDRKVLPQESGGPHVDDSQESSGTLTNEVTSTVISLLGDANAESKLNSDEKVAYEKGSKLCKSDFRCESNSDFVCGREDLKLKSGNSDEENILEEDILPNEVREISANIISQTNDTDGVRSDKPDLKLIAQKDMEYDTTDKKPDLSLSTQKTSIGGEMDSSLQKDVSMHISASPSSPLGKGSDDSPATCTKDKDEILSTKPVIVYNVKRKKSRNQDARAPTGSANTEMETDKGARSCNAVCRDKIETNHAIMPFNLGSPVADPAINPVESVDSATNNLLSVLALKETELSQAALGVLLQKKHDLCHQQQEIQDQITLCDQSIQEILDGNENSLVLKLDTIVKCCNDFLNNKTEVQHDNQAGGHGAIQLSGPKTISKPFLLMGSACQNLDNSNVNICAPAGQFMSSSTGEGLASGAAKMDFECSGEGSGCCTHETESAALDEYRPLKMWLNKQQKTANN